MVSGGQREAAVTPGKTDTLSIVTKYVLTSDAIPAEGILLVLRPPRSNGVSEWDIRTMLTAGDEK